MENWRVAALGDTGVGKSALIIQFALNCFLESYDPTIEDNYLTQLVVDNRMCLVNATDTSGNEDFAELRDLWIREAQGFILVYSVASRLSFDRLEIFRQSMLKVKRGKPVIFILVGNQCDKTRERQVSKADGAALARQYGCDFMETSAKTTQNIERLFKNIVRSLRQSSDTKSKHEPRQSLKKKKKSCDCVVV